MVSGIDLSGLKDVILPPQPAVFPFAVGWWAVLAIVVTAVCIGILLFMHWYWSVRIVAMRELKQAFLRTKTPVEFAIEISKLLKRIAMLRFGSEKVAALSDESWLRFLKQKAKGVAREDIIKMIVYALYVPSKKSAQFSKQQLFHCGKILIVNLLKEKEK